MLGRLHSIETMGLVDGPGIRTVFFLQGCPLRCSYCHNPDSQTMFSKTSISSQEVLDWANKYKSYYKRSKGGITFSGGEPLMQGEFVLETFKLLKENGFNTCIDTSGYGDKRFYREILKYTDTVILDIKSLDDAGYKDLTGKSMSGFYNFLSYINDFKGKLWIRHVMVPGLTDNEESMYKLFHKIAHLSEKIEKIEILPYHKMGLEKYEELGLEYKLKGIEEMDGEIAMEFQNLLNTWLNDHKNGVNKTKEIV